MRNVFNMDFGWRFKKALEIDEREHSHSGAYTAVKAGKAVPFEGSDACDDSSWRTVTLPHDYLAEAEISPEGPRTHGYRLAYDAWYRKTFLLPRELKDKELYLCFGGVSVNAKFYLNGSLMARSFCAYTEVCFDITDRVHFDGRPNLLSVYIDGTSQQGWWYEGAGLYRHVQLIAKEKLHIAHNGMFAKPVLKQGSKNVWFLEVESEIENADYSAHSGRVLAELIDGETVVASSLSEEISVPFTSKATVKQKFRIPHVHRWDVDDPYLYTCRVTLQTETGARDTEEANIGFRTFRVDPNEGFFLNEKHLIIKGTCNHQDHAGVGVAVPDRLADFRIRRLKEMGTNAYRCSHNPPSKEILNACDRLGLIVMDENRMFETRKEVTEQLETLVKRDRNHPSVIFWSLFNEELLQNTEEGAKIFKRLRSVVEHLDDSRLIMGAINGTMEGAGMEMDVTGLNYGIHSHLEKHLLHPEQPVIGSENNSAVSTRGCYRTDKDAHVLHCYDDNVVTWGQTVQETWKFVRENPWFCGIFIWTGFDYRGEPTPFLFPSVSSQFGILDTCGFAKDSFYFNKACFTSKPMMHLMPHWTWKPGETVRVKAVTNCDEAELFLNGRSLGRKQADVCAQPEWEVPFCRGHLVARAYKKGKCVARDDQRTAGKPYRIVLEPVDRQVFNDGQDICIVNCSVTDKHGVLVPDADNLIRFLLEGDAELLGVGNGDPNSHEPDFAPRRKLFHGRCQMILRITRNGKNARITAAGDGLVSAEFVPEIVARDAGAVIEACNETSLNAFTVSPTVHERPDPLVKIADDDMNSFIPTELPREFEDYTKGYRLYRTFFTVPETIAEAERDMPYKLHFSNMMLSGLEIYLNGKKLFEQYFPFGECIKGQQAFPFAAKAGTRAELRVLCWLDEKNECKAGLCGTVKILHNVK